MEDILFGPNFTAICIKPGKDPEIISMKNSLLSIHEILNVDCYGNRLPGFAEFEVKEIKDNICLFVNKKGEDDFLPLTRQIGRYQKFYGNILIIKVDGVDYVSLSDYEAEKYRRIFMKKHISFEDLGLPPINYDDP